MERKTDAAVPEGFRYREVYLKGRTGHGRYDDFSVRHPRMDVGHRAKIFAPFDALRGFSAAILEKKAESEREGERTEEEDGF